MMEFIKLLMAIYWFTLLTQALNIPEQPQPMRIFYWCTLLIVWGFIEKTHGIIRAAMRDEPEHVPEEE